jgi:energy-coupling factor transporter ATP-binding protein EcfA2
MGAEMVAESNILKIRFINCGSCESAELEVGRQQLNIKYGNNGVGKSTIARALNLQINGEPLDDLLPFKERSKELKAQAQPTVEGCGDLVSVMVFNEDYIEQFVFSPDELVRNSFDIFVQTADYDSRMAAIESRLKSVKEAFQDNPELDQILNDLGELAASFGKSQAGLAKSGKLHKAIGSGNKIANIPEPLKPFSPFLASDSNVKWIKWQIDGTKFSEIADDACPFCVAAIAEKRDMIHAVADEYDAKSVEHLVALQAVVDRLGEYFAEETRKTVSKIFLNKTALSIEEANFLKEIRNQVETLKDKLSQLRTMSFFTLRDAENLENAISALKIDMSLLSHLASGKTVAIVDNLNSKTDLILKEIGLLKGDVARHRGAIEKTVSEHSSEINEFLQKAGYRYEVDVVADGDSYKLRLRHIDHEGHIEGGRNHLSFGEKNALSLVLFMYECIRRKPDLVILDDPISSFDKHKKFAVMDMLFRGSKSLQGVTALLLTHDIEPVIDAGKTLRHTFNPVPRTFFLRARGGQVSEQEITPSDLQTFAQICRENLKGEHSRTLKAIYLRRHYEIIDEKGLPYHLLSSLLKQRPAPTVVHTGAQDHEEMPQSQIDDALESIQALDPAFDYDLGLQELQDRDALIKAYNASEAAYDKLQLSRCLFPSPKDNVLAKFINESYHIENDYVMQLNPRKFDPVPEHIIEACDALVANQA